MIQAFSVVNMENRMPGVHQMYCMQIMRDVLILLTINTVLLIPDAFAIIIRHDIPDSEYVNQGQLYKEFIVHLNLEQPGTPVEGEGTLIDPGWVLTAARVAIEIQPGHEVTIDNKKYAVDTVYIHPDWDRRTMHNIGLIKLAEGVIGAKTAELYPLTDESDQMVMLVGRGDTGNGQIGPTHNDMELRAAANLVEGTTETFLYWEFDEPVLNNPDLLFLEGISGPGDIGGPAFLERGGRTFLAGVNIGQSTKAPSGEMGVYGATEYYLRVSSYLNWIYRYVG